MTNQPTWMDEKLDWQAGRKPLDLGMSDHPVFDYHLAVVTGPLLLTKTETARSMGLLQIKEDTPAVAYLWRGHVVGAAGAWWNWEIRLGQKIIAHGDMHGSQERAIIDLKTWIANRRPRKETA